MLRCDLRINHDAFPARYFRDVLPRKQNLLRTELKHSSFEFTSFLGTRMPPSSLIYLRLHSVWERDSPVPWPTELRGKQAERFFAMLHTLIYLISFPLF